MPDAVTQLRGLDQVTRLNRQSWGNRAIDAFAAEVAEVISNLSIEDIATNEVDARYSQLAAINQFTRPNTITAGGAQAGDENLDGLLVVYSGVQDGLEVRHSGTAGFGLRVLNRGASIAGGLSVTGGFNLTSGSILTTGNVTAASGNFTGNFFVAGTATFSNTIVGTIQKSDQVAVSSLGYRTLQRKQQRVAVPLTVSFPPPASSLFGVLGDGTIDYLDVV